MVARSSATHDKHRLDEHGVICATSARTMICQHAHQCGCVARAGEVLKHIIWRTSAQRDIHQSRRAPMQQRSDAKRQQVTEKFTAETWQISPRCLHTKCLTPVWFRAWSGIVFCNTPNVQRPAEIAPHRIYKHLIIDGAHIHTNSSVD
jgi:hypothetical protein